MAYVSVAQADRDRLSDASPTFAASPTLDAPDIRPLSASFEQLDAKQATSTAHPAGRVESRLSSLMRSIDSSQSAYEMVENDDYEDFRPLSLHNVDTSFPITPPLDENEKEEAAQTPMRTASICRNLPLNHPKSTQGTQTKNVARLEESAERLSVTSSLEDELQKMKLDQRRSERQSSAPIDTTQHRNNSRQYSSGSITNSILGVNSAARWGGYSPSGYITSPKGSIRESTWLHRTASQGSPSASQLTINSAPPPPEHSYQAGPITRQSILEQGQPLRITNGDTSRDRPNTSASNDTSQESNVFKDFDGVHIESERPEGGQQTRRVSLTRPFLASDDKAHKELQPGKNMVFYPAPVPMMLNLPQRLSKLPTITEREKRRLHGISGVPAEMRKSVAWIPEEDHPSTDPRRSNQADLPPQLRASAFFDQPSVRQDMKLVNSSATATLDSLLDASTRAPVNAFTDHPIAGRLSKQIYRQERVERKSMDNLKSADLTKKSKVKRRSSLSNMLRIGSTSRLSRMGSSDALKDHDAGSQTSDDLERTDLIGPSDDESGSEEEESVEESEEEDEDDHRAYLGPPTTLLAELQMRKAQQKKRNRTAADAFPNGMHSTLLELDAVAQLQQKSRKAKHVTLAWEDHVAAERQNFDDEDVPLAMLLTGAKAQLYDRSRPMGLMEKRDIEDNEPLSQRRARLRGEGPRSQHANSIRQDRTTTMYTLNVGDNSHVELPEAEEEEETLGQRRQRLQAERAIVGAEFANEVTNQLGLERDKVAPPSAPPDTEETLGQRQKRLKEQRPANNARQFSGNSQPSGQAQVRTLKSRHSLADILSMHPAAGAGGLQHTEPRSSNVRPAFTPSASYMQTAPQMPTNSFVPPNYPRFPAQATPMYNPTMAAIQQGAYGAALYADIGMGPPLDPKQRDQIDRWRQGIVQ